MHRNLQYYPVDPLESMGTLLVTSVALVLQNNFCNCIYLIYLVVVKISGIGKKHLLLSEFKSNANYTFSKSRFNERLNSTIKPN